MHIKRAISELEGVKSVEGDPSSKQIKVEFSEPATDELIRATLAEINYPAEAWFCEAQLMKYRANQIMTPHGIYFSFN